MSHAFNKAAPNEANGARITGAVKFFSAKGFGFIEQDDGGGEVFFHASQLVGDEEPNAADRVSFTIGQGRDGRPRAEQVRIL
jgi:cold shock CspA family protein